MDMDGDGVVTKEEVVHSQSPPYILITLQLERVSLENSELFQQLIGIMIPEEYSSQEDVYVPPIQTLHAKSQTRALPSAVLLGVDQQELHLLQESNRTLKEKLDAAERELRQVLAHGVMAEMLT
jgi:hypothetical protein